MKVSFSFSFSNLINSHLLLFYLLLNAQHYSLTQNGSILVVHAQLCTDLTEIPTTGAFANIVLDAGGDCIAKIGTFSTPNRANWHITELSSSTSTNDTGSEAATIRMTPPDVFIPYTSSGELHFRYSTNWTGSAQVGVEISIPPGILKKLQVGGTNTSVFVSISNSTKPSIIDSGRYNNITVSNANGFVQISASGISGYITVQAEQTSVAITGSDSRVNVKATKSVGQLSGEYNELLIEGSSVSIEGTGTHAQLLLNGVDCDAPNWDDQGQANTCASVTTTVNVPTSLDCSIMAETTTLVCTSAASIKMWKSWTMIMLTVSLSLQQFL